MTGSSAGRDRFFSATAELFQETGEWPLPEGIQRTLTRWHDGTSAGREAKRLPRSYGRVEGGRVVLSIRALRRAEPTSVLLERFWTAFREAVRSYRREDREEAARISVSDLVERCGMAETSARQALKMLLAEGLVREAPQGWFVSARIRHYIRARDIDDYLRRRSRFERRRWLGKSLGRPIGRLRSACSESGAVRVVVLGAAAILLAALVLWLGGQVFPLGKANPKGKPSPAKRAAAHPSR